MEATGDVIFFDNGQRETDDFFARLNSMRNSSELVDCFLKSEDGTLFPGHKVLLLASSDYFHKDPDGDSGECHPVYTVDGVSPVIITAIMDFVYSQRVKIPITSIWDLLTAAKRFQFRHLVRQCHKYFTANLNLDDCVTIYQSSMRHHQPELADMVKTFIVTNFGNMTKKNVLLCLSSDELAEILLDDRISCQESYIWKVVDAWLNVDLKVRRPHAPKLLSSIRFGYLDLDFVFENVMKQPYVICSKECRDLVSQRMELMWDVAKMMSMQYVETKYIAKPRLPTDLLFCFDWSAETGGSKRSVIEVYDNKADIWYEISEEIEPLQDAPRIGYATVVLNNRLYVIGGRDSETNMVQNKVHCLDLVKKEWCSVSQMIKPRYGMCAVAMDDAIIVLGGSQENNILYSVESFDPKFNRWSFIGCLKKCRCWASAAVLGGNIYVVGGTSNSQNRLKTVEVYRGDTGTWNQIASMRESRRAPSCTAFKDVLFVAGGSDLSSVECYDPAANHWTILNHMMEPRNHFVLVVLDDLMCAIGGTRADPVDSDVVYTCGCEVYHAESNTWRSLSTNTTLFNISMGSVVTGIPNFNDYLYNGRENVLELRRKALIIRNLKEQKLQGAGKVKVA